jgi:hypothetical protein
VQQVHLMASTLDEENQTGFGNFLTASAFVLPGDAGLESLPGGKARSYHGKDEADGGL